MTALEKIREWIKTYPGCSQLRDLSVDYTDVGPAYGGVNPAGLMEIDRQKDILGNAVSCTHLTLPTKRIV